MNDLGNIEDVWHTHRRRLLDIGYRMLGSLADAEDATSEAYARLIAADTEVIDDLAGWLTTVTGRICLDRLRSSESSRRAYIGPWLPEPILSTADPAAVDPADRVTIDDSVRLALLVVLEQLSPAERTSLVLHDIFGVEFEEVGQIVGRSAAACRQLASRARRRIQSDPDSPRTPVDRAELEDVARRFADACRQGAVDSLLEVLDPNVIGDFDSGGTVPGAPLRSIDGAERVARVLVHSFTDAGFTFAVEDVNGDPGVVVRHNGLIAAVIALGVRDRCVDVIHAIGNQRKLSHLR